MGSSCDISKPISTHFYDSYFACFSREKNNNVHGIELRIYLYPYEFSEKVYFFTFTLYIWSNCHNYGTHLFARNFWKSYISNSLITSKTGTSMQLLLIASKLQVFLFVTK